MTRTKFAFALSVLVGCALGAYRYTPQAPPPLAEPEINKISFGDKSLRLVGPTAEVEELESGLVFRARVDTGATRCSLHTDQWEIEHELPTMNDNVGKTIRFRVTNRRGQTQWLTRQIAEVALVRTSEDEEIRYLVPLSFSLNGIEREVLVSLNDRSRMDFAMLIGRNYLDGQFVVDVSHDRATPNLLAGTQ